MLIVFEKDGGSRWSVTLVLRHDEKEPERMSDFKGLLDGAVAFVPNKLNQLRIVRLDESEGGK